MNAQELLRRITHEICPQSRRHEGLGAQMPPTAGNELVAIKGVRIIETLRSEWSGRITNVFMVFKSSGARWRDHMSCDERP
jgi:hypothetical protein